MTLPEIVMWAVVAVVGIPCALRNLTAAALVISWLTGQAIYLATGDNLPVDLYLFPDIFVIAMIMAKAEAYDCRPYRGTWHQLRCIFLERSGADRVVLGIFPLMWLLYVAPIHDFYRWWALYYLVVIQFLVVGLEEIAPLCRRYLLEDNSGRSGPSLFAFPGGGLSGRWNP